MSATNRLVASVKAMSWQLTFASNGLWSASGLSRVYRVHGGTTATGTDRPNRIKTGRNAPRSALNAALCDQ
jgi:hypothetical protein